MRQAARRGAVEVQVGAARAERDGEPARGERDRADGRPGLVPADGLHVRAGAHEADARLLGDEREPVAVVHGDGGGSEVGRAARLELRPLDRPALGPAEAGERQAEHGERLAGLGVAPVVLERQDRLTRHA